MDPLSETLSLLKLNNYISGGFIVSAKVGYGWETEGANVSRSTILPSGETRI
jgi:hypothetical protein